MPVERLKNILNGAEASLSNVTQHDYVRVSVELPQLYAYCVLDFRLTN
jgi:hypothetical protein